MEDHLEGWLVHLVENSGDFIFRMKTAPGCGFEYASPAGLRLTGYSPRELCACPELAAALIHPADRPIFDRAWRGESARGEAVSIRLLRKDGSLCRSSLQLVPVRDDAGRVVAVEGIAREVATPREPAAAPPASESSYRAIIDHAVEAIFVAADEKIVFVNPMCERLTGYSAEEFLALPSFRPLVSPADLPAVTERHRRRLMGATADSSYAFRLVRKDGSVFWAQLDAVPFQWQGRPAALNFLRDVTRLREWQERLRLQSLVLDQVQDRVVVTDLEGRITYVNQAVCRSLLRSSEESIGQQVEILGEDPARGARHREVLDAVLAHGEWRGEIVNYASDGSERIIECRTSLVRDEAGRPLGLCGLGTDITGRRRAEAELREREARYRAAVESSADGFWVTALDGRILEVNDAYVRLSGYSREQLRSMRVWELDATASPAGTLAHIEELKRAGHLQFETRHRAHDGTVWQAEITASYWPIDGGRAFCFIRDLTRRTRSDALLRSRLRLLEPAAQADLDSLMQAALDEAELLTGSTIGFFHFVDDDQENLRLQTWSTNTLQRMCRAEGKGRHYPLSEAGVWADCLRSGVPVIHNDYASLPQRKGLPPGHAEVIREIVVPVWRDGKVAAILGVGNKRTDYCEADVEVLQSLASIALDLVAHRRAELALRASETLLRETTQLLSCVLDHTWMSAAYFDTNCNYIWVNRAYANDWMRDRSCFPGRNLSDFHSDPDNLALARHAVATGEPVFAAAQPFVYPGQPGRGVTYWDAGLIPVKDAGGQVCGLVLTTFEVTERIRAEQALQAKTEELDRYFNTALDLFCIADTAGYFRHLNPQWEATLGFSPAELTGCHFLDLVHPDDREATLRAIATLSRQESVLRFTNRYRCKDGSYRWIEWSSHPEGDLIYAAARDVSGRKETEAQLMQAQKMESVGRLAGGIAHDFNNLLTVINGYSELLLSRSRPDDPLRSGLSEILKAGERAAALTGQLLAFSRKQFLQPRLADLNAIVAESKQLLERVIGEDILMEIALDPALGRVRVDAGQLGQVLMNLATNARDAMPGGGRLRIETANVELSQCPAPGEAGFFAGPYVMLGFRDSGLGMDEATQRRLFEPFFTTKAEGRGTGLGLCTVYGIVRQSGGWIVAESAPGEGTAFRIYLPRSEEPAPEAPAPEAPAPEPAPAPRGDATVLVAEDQPDVREFASTVLAAAGYRVLQAADGGQALSLAAAHDGPIHLLLTDVIMPSLSGSALAASIRSQRPETRVLFMSGYPGDVVSGRGALSGDAVWLRKPFSPEQLVRTVHDVLNPAG